MQWVKLKVNLEIVYQISWKLLDYNKSVYYERNHNGKDKYSNKGKICNFGYIFYL